MTDPIPAGRCGHAAEGRRCPRPAVDGRDRCPFHLAPDDRAAAGVDREALRAAVRADLAADDPARRTYADAHLGALDLSAMVLDADDADRLLFRRVTVDGTLDLSGAVVTHPLAFEDCELGRLALSNASCRRDVTVADTALGGPAAPATALAARRASFGRSLHLSGVAVDGAAEFAACRVEGWLDADGLTVAGPAQFPGAAVGTAQFVDATFEAAVAFDGAGGDLAAFEAVRAPAGLDLSGSAFDRLRVHPAGDLAVRLVDASVPAGRLAQPDAGVATYDCTDATLGEVDLAAEHLDRYRLYRTRFEGFPFAAYRGALREHGWRLAAFVGDPADPADTDGLEATYLAARRGATDAGDGETASVLFVRELRYRRRRYAAHARDAGHSTAHRADAAVRWATNGFLDAVAGYGERPGRTAALSVAVVAVAAVLYPALGGLTAGDAVVTYASHGLAAVVDGLYFSAVTFATLGLGDVHPVGTAGRFLAASEGLAGAFLTAVFVFSLGRRVTR